MTITEITTGNFGNGNTDIPHFYILACSNSVQYVRLHSIVTSILSHHYKQLTECISEIEHIEAEVNGRREEK
jgi:hypothetical protein